MSASADPPWSVTVAGVVASGFPPDAGERLAETRRALDFVRRALRLVGVPGTTISQVIDLVVWVGTTRWCTYRPSGSDRSCGRRLPPVDAIRLMLPHGGGEVAAPVCREHVRPARLGRARG